MANRMILTCSTMAVATTIFVLAGCGGGEDGGDATVTEASQTSTSTSSDSYSGPVFHTAEALVAHLQEILARRYHPVEEWHELLWADPTEDDQIKFLYFFEHFEVPRYLFRQTLSDHYGVPYNHDPAPIFWHQYMIPRQLAPDRVEVECKDDKQRLAYLYLRRVDGNWRIEVSTYKVLHGNRWESMKPNYDRSYRQFDDFPGNMRGLMNRIEAGQVPTYDDALIEGQSLIPEVMRLPPGAERQIQIDGQTVETQGG
ncbi:MAG: hypothetical protein AAF432_07325 [Planctomycetota bacterium]